MTIPNGASCDLLQPHRQSPLELASELGKQLVWHLAAVVGDFPDDHLMKPDIHFGGIARITGIVKIFGKFFARGETAGKDAGRGGAV